MTIREIPRLMGPLKADHPAVRDDQTCAGCDLCFCEGEYVTLVAIGPGDDPEARERAREGRPYDAVSVIAHYSCVTGYEVRP